MAEAPKQPWEAEAPKVVELEDKPGEAAPSVVEYPGDDPSRGTPVESRQVYAPVMVKAPPPPEPEETPPA